MQKISKVVLIALVVFSFSATKSWALIHVGANIPVIGKYDLEDNYKDVQRISGYGLSLVIPFGMMFRIDQLTGKATGFKSESTIYSLGYRLDFPFVPFHLAGTAGVGTAKISGSSADYSDPIPTQLYLEGGYKILPFIDLVLGLHILDSQKLEYKTKTAGSETTTKLSSSLSAKVFSLGVAVGF